MALLKHFLKQLLFHKLLLLLSTVLAIDYFFYDANRTTQVKQQS